MMFAGIKKSLARRRKGAVALLAVASMVPVTVMFAASMNTGQMMDDRRQVQDASDALAAMHATWTARSLNVISMNNVTSAQLFTVAIGSEALAGTLQELQITAGLALAYIAGHAAINCPPRSGNPVSAAIETVFWTIPCGINHALVAVPAGVAISRSISIDNAYDPDHGIAVSHKALSAIEGMNKAIIARFPRAMSEIGTEYAKVHKIDDFHFADPCDGYGTANCTKTNTDDGMALPLEKGGQESRTEFCLAMNFGTTAKFTTFRSRGFPIGKGPMRYGGSSSQPVVMDFINKETDIGSVLKDFKDFYEGDQSDLLRYIYAGFDSHPQFPTNLLGGQEKDGPNAFTRRFQAKLASLCTGINLPGNGLLRLSMETPEFTFWKLKDVSTLQVPPFAQPDQMPDAFRILAYAQKDKNRRLGSKVLNDDIESHFGYAQTGVYNPDGADLFSQNWRFRMMPATRMDDPQSASNKLNTQALAAFEPLASNLAGVSDTTTWARVNVH